MLITDFTYSIDELNNGKYIGVLEVGDDSAESDDTSYYEIVLYNSKLFYGNVCNVGLLAHGYMEYDEDFSLDENLQELHDLLRNDLFA